MPCGKPRAVSSTRCWPTPSGAATAADAMNMLRRVIDAPRDALILLVRGYRFFLSPWLGSSCRFEPTCSAYSMQALERHGAVAGSLLTVSRLARCHPWCADGYD